MLSHDTLECVHLKLPTRIKYSLSHLNLRTTLSVRHSICFVIRFIIFCFAVVSLLMGDARWTTSPDTSPATFNNRPLAWYTFSIRRDAIDELMIWVVHSCALRIALEAQIECSKTCITQVAFTSDRLIHQGSLVSTIEEQRAVTYDKTTAAGNSTMVISGPSNVEFRIPSLLDSIGPDTFPLTFRRL